MKIEEKIDNFCALLRHSYQAQQNENLVVSLEIIKNNNFDLNELDQIICPSLVSEGALRAQPSFLISPGLVEKALGEGALKEMEEISNELREVQLTYARSSSNEKEFILSKIVELENRLRPYIFYKFVVNKNKLKTNKSMKGVAEKPVWEIPENTKWENVTIKFNDEEKVEICIKNKHIAFSDFKEMKLGKRKPDKRWQLLQLLATIYATNKQRKEAQDVPATIDDLAYSLLKRVDQRAKMNVHTIKKNLSFQLEQDFGIYYDDPFYDYNQFGYYKAKFNLLPEPKLRWRGNAGIYELGKKLDQNRTYSNIKENNDDFDNESSGDID